MIILGILVVALLWSNAVESSVERFDAIIEDIEEREGHAAAWLYALKVAT